MTWVSPRSNRLATRRTTFDADGSSGPSVRCALDARPAFRAIQPACRPITSESSTRWCGSAVVCSRSMAWVAMLAAVSSRWSGPCRRCRCRWSSGCRRPERPPDRRCAAGQRALAADRDQHVDGVGDQHRFRSTWPSQRGGRWSGPRVASRPWCPARPARNVYIHLEVGEMDIAFDVSDVPGEPGLSISARVDEGSESADECTLFASWAATRHSPSDRTSDPGLRAQRVGRPVADRIDD
jgi:hypothetical protein